MKKIEIFITEDNRKAYSTELQETAFALYYSWSNGTIQVKCTESSYLFFDLENKVITRSERPTSTSEVISYAYPEDKENIISLLSL